MGVIVHYWANINYYATELCENTDKPELQCKGSCTVAEELDKTESHHNAPVSLTIKEIHPFTICDKNAKVSKLPTNTSSLFPLLPNHYTFNSVADFFHPPEHYRFS